MSVDALLALAGSPWVLLALAALVAADGLFPPIPSEALLTALAALAIGHDPFRLVPLIAAASVGSVAGDLTVYWLASRVDLDKTRLLTGARARRIIAWARPALDRRALSFLLAARFLPGGRTVSCASAGALRFGWRRFWPMSALASVVWALYTAGLGVAAGRWLTENPLAAAGVGMGIGLALGLGFDRLARAATRRRSGVLVDEGEDRVHHDLDGNRGEQ